MGNRVIVKSLSGVVLWAMLFASQLSQAIHINPNDSGQVLLFPAYTAAEGQSTLLTIVNSKDESKALRVRIMEGVNSKIVLEFNLYLAPYDHWSALIASTEDGAHLGTADFSCTYPGNIGMQKLGSAQFTPLRFEHFAPASDDQVPERVRQGHIEVFEMGVIDSSQTELLAGISRKGKLSNAGCETVAAAWQEGGAFFDEASLSKPSGGLHGTASFIHVADGTNISYNATAVGAFTERVIHTKPGHESPSFVDTNPATATLHSNEGYLSLDFASGLEAASAIFMKPQLSGDYTIENSVNARTRWYLSYPTRRHHVSTTQASAPFTQKIDAELKACESPEYSHFNRESQGVREPALDFIARPKILHDVIGASCTNSSELWFKNKKMGPVSSNIKVAHNNGHLVIDYKRNKENEKKHILKSTAPDAKPLVGLPVIGISTHRYFNGSLNGLLANYAGAMKLIGKPAFKEKDPEPGTCFDPFKGVYPCND
ncbi:hypothetical protein [uncultured Pseudoteredinibacter sp.]|uniref:hypothetical protein n=1 Tax=uncultured Pseudoteredinibacter sp. TaxID=1641701 RepID=UPI00260F8201|nr:hypothetical protein [uncultured Pseudoteredinibacter sp.]